MENAPDKRAAMEIAGEIVAAYVANNALAATDLPKLITDVYVAIVGLGNVAPEEVLEELRPAVSVRKSITPDYLICLDDGKKFKSLKRHLATLDMTPEQYRAKWGLPHDYPMVAPSYSETRSALARANGLGRKPGQKPARGRTKARA